MPRATFTGNDKSDVTRSRADAVVCYALVEARLLGADIQSDD